MRIYTIGYTKKSAQEFFEALRCNNIEVVIDVRLNNTSQLAGFTKKEDLQYFLKMILNAKYIHEKEFAPTKELLDNYRKGNINWNDYEKEFLSILNERNISSLLEVKYKMNFDKTCLLCSEENPDLCHRRLVAEYIKRFIPDIEIVHL
jgi:uncharacterized protein (DUF488 family)